MEIDKRFKKKDKISVLLVDDHSIVRQGIRSYLELQEDIEIAGETGNGEKAIELVSQLLPDVVLMDLIMPGGISGIEATRRIGQIAPNTRIIVLTSYHDDQHIFPAIKAGALSYILKDIEAPQLLYAIRLAANGEAILSPAIAKRMIIDFNPEKPDPHKITTALTGREMEVLQLVANGFTNAEIAEKLFIHIKTVRAHVSNILSKLHLKDRTQAAVYAWRKGIVKNNKNSKSKINI